MKEKFNNLVWNLKISRRYQWKEKQEYGFDKFQIKINIWILVMFVQGFYLKWMNRQMNEFFLSENDVDIHDKAIFWYIIKIIYQIFFDIIVNNEANSIWNYS